MLKLAVLGSGSSGNSALVCHEDTRILVDAGLSARQLSTRLELIGVDPESLSAVVLTHEHGDHIRGLGTLCSKTGIPILCNRLTQEAIQNEFESSRLQFTRFETGATFSLGDDPYLRYREGSGQGPGLLEKVRRRVFLRD